MCALSQVPLKPSFYIDAMLCGYSSEVRARKLLVILNAHVDDSGSDEHNASPQRYFMLAGYIMPAERWKAFSDEWASELLREPRVQCFKMSDAEYGDGYFEGMREEFRRLKVNELAQIIYKFQPKPISCHVSWEDYRRIVRGRVHPKVDSPYGLLFYQLIKRSHDWQIEANQSHPEIGFHKVDFVFDEQGKTGIKALQWYEGLRDRLPEPYKSMLGSTPVFRDDEEIVALQAADMLAWHLHRYLDRPGEVRPAMNLITIRHEGSIMSERSLSDFVRNMGLVDPKELEDRGIA